MVGRALKKTNVKYWENYNKSLDKKKFNDWVKEQKMPSLWYTEINNMVIWKLPAVNRIKIHLTLMCNTSIGDKQENVWMHHLATRTLSAVKECAQKKKQQQSNTWEHINSWHSWYLVMLWWSNTRLKMNMFAYVYVCF